MFGKSLGMTRNKFFTGGHLKKTFPTVDTFKLILTNLVK